MINQSSIICMGDRPGNGPSYRFELYPNSRTTSKWDAMSDSNKEVVLKTEKQLGVVNVEDVSLTQYWFRIHLRSAGSVIGVGIILVLIVCLFKICRRKMCLRFKDICF